MDYLQSPLVIRIKKEVPFYPDEQQVIYFESSFNKELNNYITNNYKDIYTIFKERGLEFVHIPRQVESLGINEAKYLNPTITQRSITSNTLSAKDIYNSIISLMDSDPFLSGGLLKYKAEEDKHYVFTYCQFNYSNDFPIREQFLSYTRKITFTGEYYSIITPHPYIENPEDNADYDLDSESLKLVNEIKERIDTLKQKGVNEMILKSIFSFEPVKLSRLVITGDYRIFLRDYNNMEIKMFPLPKAIFFLFLNHPEGILFKNLPDYRDELIAIYKKLTGRESINDIEKSIDDAVNPTLNSINEKCSRIREAFVTHFDESIAQNYFITGDRATPKKIALDRSLLILEGVNLKVEITKTPFNYTRHTNHYNQPPVNDINDIPF